MRKTRKQNPSVPSADKRLGSSGKTESLLCPITVSQEQRGLKLTTSARG